MSKHQNRCRQSKAAGELIITIIISITISSCSSSGSSSSMNVLAGTSVSQFPVNRRTYCQSDSDLRVLMGSADGVRD